jgi:serine/threonine protein kinase
MEYCPGGTLADAAKAGLPEDMVRKYTKELLVAIIVLHEHQIVHRDIKGMYTAMYSFTYSLYPQYECTQGCYGIQWSLR